MVEVFAGNWHANPFAKILSQPEQLPDLPPKRTLWPPAVR
jgi:hypothetical protein